MRHVSVEPLESRRLLAAQIVNGELIATGTDQRDDIELRRVNTDDVRVTIRTDFSSTPTSQQTFDLDDFDSIRALGLDGNDYLHVVGNVTLPNLTLDGGAGDFDVLLSRNARFVDGEEIYNGSGTRVIHYGFGPLSYDVHGTSGADRISWRFVNGADRVEVNSSFVGTIVRTDFGYNRSVVAGAGNDTIIVGVNMSASDGGVFGGDGDDFFDVAANVSVPVHGDNGNDTLFARGGPDNNDYHNISSAEVETIRMDGQTELRLDTTQAGFFAIANVTEAQGTVFGNHLDNRITVRASNTAGVTVHGREGDDTIIGGKGPDKLFGEEGHDTLTGNDANDLLDGGPGIDNLSGGPGDDTLLNGENSGVPQFFIDVRGADNRNLTAYGTLGADTMSAVRTGIDDVRITVNGVSRTFDMDDFDAIYLDGGPGGDTISAGNGITAIHLLGGAGNDRLNGNEFNNGLEGNSGDDTIFGNAGHDAILGGDGNDTIDGGAGDEIIDGGNGNDTITGGPGSDEMFGRLGNDTFFARDGEADDVFGDDDEADRAQADAVGDNLLGIEEILP